MTWSEFKAKVDDLLDVERKRLGAQKQIDLWVSIAVGDVQRRLDYYRTGITSTYDADDLMVDGFASKGKLPTGSNLREAYHVKTGAYNVRRPLHEYPFSNRNDLRAGVVDINCGTDFYFCVDHRSKDFWAYPLVTSGYQIQLVWDSLVGRNVAVFADTDEVPFDEPVTQLVYDWVKSKLAMEVDRDPRVSEAFMTNYARGISSLYSEVQERLRLKQDRSDATCVRCSTYPCVCGLFPITNCGYQEFVPEGGVYQPWPGIPGYWPSCAACSTTEVPMPKTMWVMFGDSGERAYIQNTTAVATAVKAVEPKFIVHLGDASYPTSSRPGDPVTSNPSPPDTLGGAAYILDDLFVRHYWNYIANDRMYIALGNHDLETNYGAPTLKVLSNVSDLIGQENLDSEVLMYEFADGPVRFFVLNSGWGDADTNIRLDLQTPWLLERTSIAAEPWLVVVFHRPAYTSDSSHHPGSELMKTLTDQLPAMGVDLVVCGHAHSYERFLDANGLPHVICGTGGAALRPAAATLTVTGSQRFIPDKYGFLLFTADENVLKWDFRSPDNSVLDSMTLRKNDA